jgi:hypothetical protein
MNNWNQEQPQPDTTPQPTRFHEPVGRVEVTILPVGVGPDEPEPQPPTDKMKEYYG